MAVFRIPCGDLAFSAEIVGADRPGTLLVRVGCATDDLETLVIAYPPAGYAAQAPAPAATLLHRRADDLDTTAQRLAAALGMPARPAALCCNTC